MASVRAKIAVQKLSENIRNSGGKKSISMGKVLREAGYSKQTSLKPKLVTETKGFKDELSNLMPDKTIIEKHGELINAVKLNKMVFDSSVSDLDIKKIVEWSAGFKVMKVVRKKGSKQVVCFYWSPDYMTRLVAINMGYKIKNLYQPKEELTGDTPFVWQVVSYDKVNCNK
jgi:hypothetical protein